MTTARLQRYLEAGLALEPELHATWKGTVLPAAVALERVEAWGVCVNAQAITNFDRYLEIRETKLKASLDQYGPELNWDSPPQVGHLLFNVLKLTPVKLTKGGGQQSTDGEVLEVLSKQHPLPRDLLDYRFVTKMRGTYASGMFPHVRRDGRIHPNIKLDGARSGRTSCVDPNLQNIPRAADSPEGKMARDCFVAPPGYKLLEVDYSQLELRVAAALSGDPLMIAIFEEGVDYHLRTAQMVSKIAWGIESHEVEAKHRSEAKTINFGLLYGMGDDALAVKIGCSKKQAGRIREAILGTFKVLAAWIQKQLREAQRTGVSWTWWDGKRARRRPLWQIADKDDFKKSVAEHSSWNTPIQGTASDFCVMSLARCVEWIEQDNVPGVKLVLAVHDSLLFEVRDDMVQEVALTVNDIMTSHPSNGVKLVADFKLGEAWGSMESYDIAA